MEQKWNELINYSGISPNKYSNIVMEHTLLHFWIVKESSKVAKKSPEISLKTCNTIDESELEAIRYHGE